MLIAWLIVYFPWLPGWPLNRWLPDMPSALVTDALLAAQYALIAMSLVVLVGWVGQISLGQGAFVGIGAFGTALLAREFGVPFPLSLPLVAVISGAVAALLGVVALRVRGLYLAVATLIFAWMCDAYLFRARWFVGEGGSAALDNRPIGDTAGLTFFDFSNPNTLYLVMVAAVAATWFTAVNLRDSKTGRAFFAIRGSEMAAVSLGVDVVRYKLLAFAISGALAGVAGNLIMVDLRAATPSNFQFTESLFFLGIAVVGGITSLGGAVAAGGLFAGLDEVFFRVALFQGWRDVVAIGLLLGVLLGYPGGLGALGPAITGRAGPRWRVVKAGLRQGFGAAWRFTRRLGNPATFGRREPEGDGEGDVPVAATAETPEGTPERDRKRRRLFRRGVGRRSIDLEATRERVRAEEEAAVEAAKPPAFDWRNMDWSGFELPRSRSEHTPVLEAEHVTVRFGGLTAVDDVSLAVREHEIVGLIGPNGAGKTTTFNAIAGLNEPTSGTVALFGEDVTDLPVHLRAHMGMGRTFQLIQLFSQLTVFENLLVATHVANPTGVVSHVALTGPAIVSERRARQKVRLVVELLGLEEVADRPVAGLPFGILRQVEIARALVTEAPLLMLDEPASGLDNTETDELMQLLRYLRAELGVTILLIEHDVRMVTAVSDYMYVLNQGKLLAEGTPAEIQRNPDVVAAYLGTSVEEDGEVGGETVEEAEVVEMEPV